MDEREARSRLVPTDFGSGSYRKLEDYMRARLDRLRKNNDDISRDAVQTALLRGQIVEIKNFLALGEPAPEE